MYLDGALPPSLGINPSRTKKTRDPLYTYTWPLSCKILINFTPTKEIQKKNSPLEHVIFYFYFSSSFVSFFLYTHTIIGNHNMHPRRIFMYTMWRYTCYSKSSRYSYILVSYIWSHPNPPPSPPFPKCTFDDTFCVIGWIFFSFLTRWEGMSKSLVHLPN